MEARLIYYISVWLYSKNRSKQQKRIEKPETDTWRFSVFWAK